MQTTPSDKSQPVQIHHENDLEFIFQMVKDQSGVCLNDDSDLWVLKCLAPVIRENGFSYLSDLVGALKSGRSGLRTAVVNAVMPYETSFFRDKKPFDFLKTNLLPDLLKKSNLKTPPRIWSAGCSSGQEIYSLAMTLDQVEEKDTGPTVDLLATDISASILDQAKRGVYGESDVRKGITGELLRSYFRPHGGDWIIDSALRGRIKFQHHNLLDGLESFGFFDGIVCRNVLNIFDPKTRRKVIEKFERVLKPSGFLILGYGETLMGLSRRFHLIDGLRGGYRFIEDRR